jgi:hypothetical protein
MTPERFWRCVPCDAVIRLTGHDAGSDLLGPLWFAAAQQERAAFLETHRAHLIELLTQTRPDAPATGPLWDPRTIIRWQVRNGSRSFVIEGGRTIGIGDATAVTLGHPVQYRCQPGELRLVTERIGVSADALAQAIDDAFFPHVLPCRRLQTLTDTAAEAIANLTVDQLDVLYDAPADPTVSVARLSEDALARVLSRLRTLLGPNEQARLGARLTALRSADELLVTIVRRYEIAPAA